MSTVETSPLVVEPVSIGPSWERDENGEFVLPEFSLGYELAARWIPENLQHPGGDDFQLTPEQARLLVWWYAIDPKTGRFVYGDGVVQRLKGWGKDPFAAVIAAVELVGPCRFSRMTDRGPIGVPHSAAWIQVVATSKDQTRNTMTLFPGLFKRSTLDRHGIDLGKEIIYAYGGSRRIEAVTSSPRAVEGGRTTFTIANETHHWIEANEGHELWKVIQRNAMKATGGTSRVLAITNAYQPSEDSVAQRTREGWEKQQEGKHIDTGIMYDSLEAPPKAELSPEVAPAVIEAVRGDSYWVDPESYTRFILDPRTSPSEARRFGYNQIAAAEDAWLDPQNIEARAESLPELPSDEWTLFFDGSKSDDATGLVGCRLSDGYVVRLGVWTPPKGERGKRWIVDRYEVDQTVRAVMEERNVVGFYADPSHAMDEDGEAFWDDVIDGWHRDYGEDLEVWPVRSGPNRHSVMFDMSSSQNQKLFVAEAERTAAEFKRGGIVIDDDVVLKQHLRNARRYPTSNGISLMKENRSSSRKIDLAVCTVGARMVRRFVLNRGRENEKRSGRVI